MDVDSEEGIEYREALKSLIETIVKSGGWVSLPGTFKAVSEGIEKTPAHQHIQDRIKWSTFKHATGGVLLTGKVPAFLAPLPQSQMRSLSCAHILISLHWHPCAGWDLHFFREAPSPIELLQQVAYTAAAVADHGKCSDAPRLEVQVDLLEEGFQYIADRNQIAKYQSLESEFGIPLKGLQFSIMRLLCLLYRQVCHQPI